MFDLDRLRNRQEQRRARALESWNQAKNSLEAAIALAETKELEFHQVSEDVRRMIEALDLVVSMAKEPEHAAESQPPQGKEPKAEDGPEGLSDTQGVTSSLAMLSEMLDKPSPPLLVKKSSRPFFLGKKRAETLSILQ